MEKTTYVVWTDGDYATADDYEWEPDTYIHRMHEHHYLLSISSNIKEDSAEFHAFIEASNNKFNKLGT